MTEPPFLRSLSWYQKGLYTEDPLDKFLSFWIAIEIAAKRSYRSVPSIDQEQAKTGTKSQIRECFKVLWARMNHGQIYLAKKCGSMRTTKLVMILSTGTNQ
jgi:hypothetical protein